MHEDAYRKCQYGGNYKLCDRKGVELDLEKVSEMTPDEAMEALCEIKGVGPKVASCAMLFGLGMTSAFPIDVWIKRVIAKYYPDGLDIPALGEYAGIAQQYLFYYERYNVGN